MKPKRSPKSTIGSPDFRAPYIKVDQHGNVNTPDTQLVRGTEPMATSFCKSSMPIGQLAEDLVRKFSITRDNIATIGQVVGRDYAHLEDADYDTLYKEMAHIVEGPLDVPEEVGKPLLRLFGDTFRNWNGKGELHPDTLHSKEQFEQMYDGHIPKEIWNLPMRQAEEAFIDLAVSSEAMAEAVDEVDREEHAEQAKTKEKEDSRKPSVEIPDDAKAFLVVPVDVKQ